MKRLFLPLLLLVSAVAQAQWYPPGGGGGDMVSTNNLSELSNKATARTNLGVAIGTNVQAFDSDLNTWSAITPGSGWATILAATKPTTLSGYGITDGNRYTMVGGTQAAFSPADATTYYVGYGGSMSTTGHTTYSNAQMTVPWAGTIVEVDYIIVINGNGTGESVEHDLRLNNTTDTQLSTTATYNGGAGAVVTFRYTGLSISVAANDTIAFKIVAPTWATNPTLSGSELRVFIQ